MDSERDFDVSDAWDYATLVSDAGAAAPRLCVLEVTFAGYRRIALSSHGPVVVGRGSSVDVRVSHPSISRRHARLGIAGERATITDLESHNGSYVNGKRVEPNVTVPLHAGDRFELGSVEFVVERTFGEQIAIEAAASFRREIERALACATLRGDRTASVLAVLLEAQTDTDRLRAALIETLRLQDSLLVQEPEILLFIPGVDHVEAPVAKDRILQLAVATVGRVAVGHASYPHDGGDAPSLIAAARRSARKPDSELPDQRMHLASGVELGGSLGIDLSTREMETLHSILRGDGNKVGAAAMGVSVSTYREYKKRLAGKLGLQGESGIIPAFYRRLIDTVGEERGPAHSGRPKVNQRRISSQLSGAPSAGAKR